MANIVIGKIGRVFKFKDFDMYTGNSAPAIFYSALAQMYPENNYYIIGPNDLSKLTPEEYTFIFPNKNVFSLYGKPVKYPDAYAVSDLDFTPSLKTVVDSGVKFDYGIIFNGMNGLTGVPRYCGKLKTRNEYAKCLLSYAKYQGIYVYILNKLNIPWYLLAEDGRYITVNSQDVINDERISFTQCTDRVLKPVYDRMRNEGPLNKIKYAKPDIRCKFVHLETIFMMGTNKFKQLAAVDFDRKIKASVNPKLIVLSNEQRTKGLNDPNNIMSRYDCFKEYVFDQFPDAKVYGNWTKETLEKHPTQIENVLMANLKNEIADAKYTFVFSTTNGFVTIKAYEMILMGLIPFLHPSYDPEHLLELPEFLYVKSPEDLKQKIEILDTDSKRYKQLFAECVDALKPGYFDGSILINDIMNKIAEDRGESNTNREGITHKVYDHFNANLLQF